MKLNTSAKAKRNINKKPNSGGAYAIRTLLVCKIDDNRVVDKVGSRLTGSP